MRKLMIAVAFACLTVGTLFAGDKEDVLAVVKQTNDAFNKGDTKTVFALSTDEMSIIDEIPPHEWHGAGAFAKWFADYDTDAKKNGITDGAVTLGKAKHVDVTGDRAYVVMAATLNFKQNGKPQKEAATWTFAMVKAKDGWKITGWAWAKS